MLEYAGSQRAGLQRNRGDWSEWISYEAILNYAFTDVSKRPYSQ